ncbi:MAG: malate dehydrogenase [Dehalococcoidia bacterium]|nr:malate dehydrogenase [Dehalococcoidia bacterium]
MKITIIGAGNVGATLAQRLIERDFADVVLLDIIEGLPQGKALDIQQSAPILGFTHRILGTNRYEDTDGSDVVVVTSGIARKPGMTREELIKINAGIVSDVVAKTAQHSPDSIIITVANPVDALTYLALKASGFSRHRVFGLSGVLDSARFASFIAQELNVSATEVSCFVLGEHGQNMVVLPRLAKVKGQPLADLVPTTTIAALSQHTVGGGAEIVSLLKTSSAFYAPSAAILKMVLAVAQDKKELMPVAAYLTGEYGLSDVVIGVPVRLGKNGISEFVELELTFDEKEELAASAEAVRQQIASLPDQC